MDAYSFPLSWRWTQQGHFILPPEVMAQIIPVVGKQRRDIDETISMMSERIATASIEPEDVRQWLGNRKIGLDEPIVISWDDVLAVQSKWSIFCEYWDAFCYPSSDDVDVFPISRHWRLRYHHWEEFEFQQARIDS